MAKRHKDALAIQAGACNPSGIAHALLDAINEIRNEPEYGGTDGICNDAAVKLIAHQLAFIVGIVSGADEFIVGRSNLTIKTYSQCTRECEAMNA